MHDRMTGSGRRRKLWGEVQGIACCNSPHRKISINCLHLFPRTGAMAAQAIVVLIDGRSEHGYAISDADTRDILLRSSDQRRRRKDADSLISMWIVAIYAGRMTVVIEKNTLRSIMGIGRRWKWMPGQLAKFGKHVGIGLHLRDVGAIVACDAILFVLPT